MEIQEKLISGTEQYPFHVSIGGVVVNKDKKVCVHYFDTITVDDFTADNFYILMRESPDPGENYQQTLTRGLKEEFGLTAKPLHYIGSIQDALPFKNNKEKTTLYFLCEYDSLDVDGRKLDDPESHSKIEWHDVDFLIEKMILQGKKYSKYGIDEHVIIERVKELISH